ncbi:hypothetical protein PENSPDRAFT_90302 [Peniophora sp. CONT]|nr:hypothetical protein PENSPDRAFT_90302 [Peniophora sp. CONT]
MRLATPEPLAFLCTVLKFYFTVPWRELSSPRSPPAPPPPLRGFASRLTVPSLPPSRHALARPDHSCGHTRPLQLCPPSHRQRDRTELLAAHPGPASCSHTPHCFVLRSRRIALFCAQLGRSRRFSSLLGFDNRTWRSLACAVPGQHRVPLRALLRGDSRGRALVMPPSPPLFRGACLPATPISSSPTVTSSFLHRWLRPAAFRSRGCAVYGKHSGTKPPSNSLRCVQDKVRDDLLSLSRTRWLHCTVNNLSPTPSTVPQQQRITTRR